MSDTVRIHYGTFNVALEGAVKIDTEDEPEERETGTIWRIDIIRIYFNKECLAEVNTMLIEKYGLLDVNEKRFEAKFYSVRPTDLNVVVRGQERDFVFFNKTLKHLYCWIDEKECCFSISVLESTYMQDRNYIDSRIVLKPRLVRKNAVIDRYHILPRFGEWFKQKVSEEYSDKPRQLGLIADRVYRKGILSALAYTHSEFLLHISELEYREVGYYPSGYKLFVGDEEYDWDGNPRERRIYVAYAPGDTELGRVVSILCY